MVYASQGRVNLGGEGASVHIIHIHSQDTRAHGRARGINKEVRVYTDTRVCTRKYSRVLKPPIYVTSTRVHPTSAFLFSTSPSRAPSSVRMSRSTRGVIILSKLWQDAHSVLICESRDRTRVAALLSKRRRWTR